MAFISNIMDINRGNNLNGVMMAISLEIIY